MDIDIVRAPFGRVMRLTGVTHIIIGSTYRLIGCMCLFIGCGWLESRACGLYGEQSVTLMRETPGRFGDGPSLLLEVSSEFGDWDVTSWSVWALAIDGSHCPVI